MKSPYCQAAAETIFPELRESEDERIRKELITYLDTQDAISNRKDKDFKSWIAWLEKQGKQNPADNIEPKFHNGQWIVWQDKNYKVNYDGCGYELLDQNGLSISLEYKSVDKDAHLWSIEDAKDGDMLAEHETIVLFKKIEGQNIRCYCTYHYLGFNPTFYVGTLQNKNPYCPVTKEQRDLLLQKMKEIGYEWDAEKKELRTIEHKSLSTEENELNSLTFLTELGYTCIPPTKEKHAEWSEDDEEVLNNIITAFKRIGENCEHYFSPDTAKVFEKTLKSLKDKVQLQPKQKWSEEDESMLTRCIGILGKCYMKELPNKVEEELIWLKSIKSKIQPNKEWSKEDNERLLRIHQFIWANRKGDTDEIYQQEQDADWLMTLKPQLEQEWSEKDKEMLDNCLGLIQEIDSTQEEQNWLKSLKPQTHWKPSEKQMEAFAIAVHDAHEHSYYKNLFSLYNDLLKL